MRNMFVLKESEKARDHHCYERMALPFWDAHCNVERHRGQSLWSLASQAGLMRLSTSSSADRIIGSREVSLSKGRSKTSEICQQNSKDSARTGGPLLSSQRPQFGSQKTEYYTNTICNLIESATGLIVTSCNCRYCFIHTVNWMRQKPEKKQDTHKHTHTHESNKKVNTNLTSKTTESELRSSGLLRSG